MGPRSLHQSLILSLATLAILSTLTSGSKPRIPDYAETIDRARNIGRSTGNLSLYSWQLQQAFPLLFQSTKFQHELMKWVEEFSASGSFQETLWAMDISPNCSKDMNQFLEDLLNRRSWATTMIDAMGKPGPDLKMMNLVWPGAFKECLDMNKKNALIPVGNFTPAPFNPKYCTAGITLAPPTQTNPLNIEINMGICVPDSCSEADLAVIINTVLGKLNMKLPAPASAVCQVVDPPFDSLAIGALVVGGLFALLMIVGTIVDLMVCQLPKWRQEKLPDLSTNSPCDAMTYHDDIVLLGGLAMNVPEPKFGYKILIAFSVYTNGAKLLSTEQTAGTLGCIHGIRFLSMTWVVLGHSYLMPIGASANMYGFFSEAVGKWSFQTIANATVSVDTFFILSGLLVSYLSLKELKRSGGKINWFKFYFHRFWRLTPPYMLIIFMYLALGKYFGSGPQWLPEMGDRDNCKKAWWTNLLYINNFVYSDQMCLGQSWYLANDMQFFIVSPLLFVPLYSLPIAGAVVVLVFLAVTIVTPAALTMKEHSSPGFLVQVDATAFDPNWQQDYYIKPYNRMGPYIIGIIVGYLLYRTNCKFHFCKAVSAAGWLVAAGLGLAVLYGLFPYHSGQDPPVYIPLSLAAAYNALARTAWAVAVGWVVFACVTGNGGFVNTILSWKAFVPLSRLTYCIYLLHMMMLSAYLFSRDTVFYLNDTNVVVLFLALLVACYAVSAVVSLAFEAPMLALEKLILKKD